MHFLDVGIQSIHCYALETGQGYLLVDTGLPGTKKPFFANLKRRGIAPGQVRFLVLTHFHPDHGGLAQELKTEGASLILADCQVPHLDQANRALSRFPGFRPIEASGNLVLPAGDAVAFRRVTGVDGLLLSTPGHSEDSISVVIRGLGVLTGDLRLPEASPAESREQVEASWEKIKASGEKVIFPAHGDSFYL